MNADAALRRSQSLVERGTTLQNGLLIGSITSVSAAGDLDISRRVSQIVVGSYAYYSVEEITALCTAASSRLRVALSQISPKPLLSNDIATRVFEAALYIPPTQKKKWWSKWRPGTKENKENSNHNTVNTKDLCVMNVALCKSIEYASAPCDDETPTSLHRRIPILASECITFLKSNGLKSNGIFRVNGSEKRMAQLAKEFDSAPTYGSGFKFEGYTVYDVADFLKKFIRGFPEPLLSTDLYPFFLKCLEVPVEGGQRLKAFRWLLMLLPPPHLVLLEQLLDLFSKVIQYADVNQMTSNNLARIISPNILKPKTEKQALENYDQFSFTSRDFKPMDIIDVAYLLKKPKLAVTAPTLSNSK
ncbi:hypothetical protein HK100_002453, partial [Physocladia obscura]